MRTKITENDVTRIVKKVLNENTPSLEGVKDELRSVTRRLTASMDDYGALQRKGDYKKMGDEVDNIRRLVRKLKDVIQQIDSKI
jgi:polyhydroxyalkanoate synthesis regulator phasin